MKGEQLRAAIEDAGFLVFPTGTRAVEPFIVRTTALRDVASYDCTEDGAFRLGIVQGHDKISWPEFFDALHGVKR